MPKLQTIQLNKDFRRAYYQGKFKAHPLLVTYRISRKGRERGDGRPRIGITTSKKIGCAVRRNRARRIIRQAFFELLREKEGHAELFDGLDYVFVARPGTPNSSTQEVKRIMRRQLAFLASPAQSAAGRGEGKRR